MSSVPRARFLPEWRLRSPLTAWLVAGAALIVPSIPGAVRAQQAGYGQTLGTTPMERQLYDGGSGGKSGSDSILDSTNPLDLLNKLRRSTAMDDATPPASAIDQALQQLEAQNAPAQGPGAGRSGQVGSAATVGGSPAMAAPVWSVQGMPSPAPSPLTAPASRTP